MTHHRYRFGALELHLSHDRESLSCALYRGDDCIFRATGFGPARVLGVGLDFAGHGAGEDPIRLHLHALLGRLYLAFGGELAERIAGAIAGSREIETCVEAAAIEAGDGLDVMIRGALLADRWSGKRSDPRFAVSLRGALLGGFTCEHKALGEQLCEVALPEGVYQVRFVTVERVTKRRRWFAQRSQHFEAHVHSGPGARASIPVPGKGESAHDCEQDAWFTLSIDAPTVEAAIGALVGRVLERRRRYGGAGWRPLVVASPAA